jgi:hypothetical protein
LGHDISIIAEIAIENSAGESGDPCGIAPPKRLAVSIFLSKPKANDRSVVNPHTHLSSREASFIIP